jgi:hypothetical protein
VSPGDPKAVNVDRRLLAQNEQLLISPLLSIDAGNS